MSLAEGDVLGGYRIVRLVGRGGMGVVYLADDVRLGRKVALKVLTSEAADQPRIRERFLRESQIAASLDHPNILPIYDAGEADGQPYIAMRYVPGLDLDGLIKRDGSLSLERTSALIDQIASALDAAHAAGLIHRDVKPGNILVATGSQPGSDHAYLSDFGLTKHAEYSAQLTRSGQMMGSVGYVAPEQIENRPIDRRVDVYSLGCVVFECLTSAQPYPRDSEMATLYAHVQAPPPSLAAARPELAPSVDAVIAKALAKEPDERYATAGELAKALAAAAAPDVLGRHLTRGFLFADLRGYTAFVEARGDAAAAALLEVYRRLVRDVVRRFGGAEIKTEGDSFYVVFPSASDAVRCGLAITAAAASASAEHPDRSIRVGVGIHAGESTETTEGYVGSAVNIAARICAQAAPGEVLVSDTVRSLTRTSGEIGFTARGRKHLKGIAEPVAVFAASAGLDRGSVPVRSATGSPVGRTMRRAAIAVPVVLVLVLGAALGLNRALGPSPTSAPSTAPSPAASATSAAAVVAPSSTAATATFPNAAEAMLLAGLPSDLRPKCVRGRGQLDLVAAGFSGKLAGHVDVLSQQVPLASVTCTLVGEAPTGLWFVWYSTGTSAPAPESLGYLGTKYGASDRDCASPPASGSWRSALGASGSIVCLSNTGPGGQPWLYWTFGSSHVLAVATAPVGQYQALYSWWQRLMPFLN
jgi:class 3 adenylate cyclase